MAASSFTIRNNKKGKIGPLEPTYKPPESLSSWKPKNDAWNAIIAKIHAKVTQQSIVKHLQENSKKGSGGEKDIEKDTLQVPTFESPISPPKVHEKKPEEANKAKDKKKKKVRYSSFSKRQNLILSFF